MAIRAVFGSTEFDVDDLKFHYNPISNLLEPISKEVHSNAERAVSGFNPWYFNSDVVAVKPDYLNNFQFTHTFVRQGIVISDFFNVLQPLIDTINPSLLVRVKANLQPYSAEQVQHAFHFDEKYENAKITTGIYYINDNNGYTIFKDGYKIQHVANRFLEFDSHMLHTGANCTDKKRRIVINLNYIK